MASERIQNAQFDELFVEQLLTPHNPAEATALAYWRCVTMGFLLTLLVLGAMRYTSSVTQTTAHLIGSENIINRHIRIACDKPTGNTPKLQTRRPKTIDKPIASTFTDNNTNIH